MLFSICFGEKDGASFKSRPHKYLQVVIFALFPTIGYI